MTAIVFIIVAVVILAAAIYASEEMQEWDVIDAAPLPPLPEKAKPPTHQELIDKFGIDACNDAGVFQATTEDELWQAMDKLSIILAKKESESES